MSVVITESFIINRIYGNRGRNSAVFKNGNALYHENKVQLISRDNNLMKAIVINKNATKQYHVEYDFKNDVVKCNCACFENNRQDKWKGLCKHQVALLLTVMQNENNEKNILRQECGAHYDNHQSLCLECGSPMSCNLEYSNKYIPSDRFLQAYNYERPQSEIDEICKKNFHDNFLICDDELIKYNGADKIIYIPYGVKTICEGAFYEANIEYVYVPSSLVLLDNKCFKSSKIKGIRIPENVSTLGELAFANCLDLEQVIIDNGVKYIGKKCFEDCGLKEISLPKSIKEMGVDVFKDCCNLVLAKIQSSIIYLPSGTFSGCASLKKVVLPRKLKSIGKDIRGEKNNNVMNLLQNYSCGVFDNCGNLESVSGISNVEYICSYAFAHCKKLKKLTLTRISYIENNAFYNCINLMIIINVTESQTNQFSSCDFLGVSKIVFNKANNQAEVDKSIDTKHNHLHMDEKEHPIIGPLVNAPKILLIIFFLLALVGCIIHLMFNDIFSAVITGILSLIILIVTIGKFLDNNHKHDK